MKRIIMVFCPVFLFFLLYPIQAVSFPIYYTASGYVNIDRYTSEGLLTGTDMVNVTGSLVIDNTLLPGASGGDTFNWGDPFPEQNVLSFDLAFEDEYRFFGTDGYLTYFFAHSSSYSYYLTDWFALIDDSGNGLGESGWGYDGITSLDDFLMPESLWMDGPSSGFTLLNGMDQLVYFDITFSNPTDVAPVPEPATVLLLGAGLLGLGWYSRTRKKS